MTITVIGPLCTGRGLVQHYDAAGDAVPYARPANVYLRHQPAVIPVFFEHDDTWQLGNVGHLERSRSGLMAVSRIERDDLADLLIDGDWYFSDGTSARRSGLMKYGNCLLEELSLVRSTANVGTRPIAWARTDIATDSGGQPHMPLTWRDTWKRAHERMSSFSAKYRRADHLTILDLDELDSVDEMLTDPVAARRLLDSRRTPTAKATTRTRATTNEDWSRVYRHSYPNAGLALVDPGLDG